MRLIFISGHVDVIDFISNLRSLRRRPHQSLPHRRGRCAHQLDQRTCESTGSGYRRTRHHHHDHLLDVHHRYPIPGREFSNGLWMSWMSKHHDGPVTFINLARFDHRISVLLAT